MGEKLPIRLVPHRQTSSPIRRNRMLISEY